MAINRTQVRPPVESYHTQHSPFGAFASFTVGLVDAPGGFGQSLPGAAQQNIYVGYRTPEQARWQLLPFLAPPKSQESAFTGDTTVVPPPSGFDGLRPTDYKRTLGLASDTWRADSARFGFSLLSPFGVVPDPAKMSKATARFHLAPQISGWIEYDNRAGKADVELMFGVGDAENTLRPLPDTHPKLLGFAGGLGYGYATPPARGVALRQGLSVLDPKFFDYRGLHVIAGETALVFTVPAGQRRRFPLALGFFAAGTVTTGLPACYAYTRVYRDLEDVLTYGLVQHARYVR
ncbi:MAG: glycoside hydrolase family 52 protein, partial [Opitutae bacterium]